ncbi:MAG: hypothetical protein KDD44_10325, partial [Bdellovibrionales bacterium]|nr:hypothetical protein [Bdellovibrionales bacterium]
MELPYIQILQPELNFIGVIQTDPLLALAHQLLRRSPTQASYGMLQLLVMGLGMYGFGRALALAPRQSLCAALILVAGTLSLVGLDLFALQFYWFPALAAAATELRKRVSIVSVACALTVGMLWSFTAGNYSVWGLLLLVLLQLVPAPERDGESSAAVPIADNILRLALLLVLLGFSLNWQTLHPLFEHYAENTRLAPISALTFLSRPLFGRWLHPKVLLFEPFQQQLALSLTLFGALTLCFAVIITLFARSRSAAWQSAAWLIIIWLVLACEYIAPDTNLRMMPFQALRRVVPGLAGAPMPWLYVLPPLVLIVAYTLRELSVRGSTLLFVAVSLLALTDSLRPSVAFPDCNKNQMVFECTPSALIERVYGSWVKTPRSFRDLCRVPLSAGGTVDVRAEPHEDTAALAIDGRRMTRWATGRPQQPGDF